MILLDTNVISALMLAVPDQAVEQWLDRQPESSIWTTTVTLMELRSGVLSLPAGRRRLMLLRELEAVLNEEIQGRYASFDVAAAEHTAELLATRRKRGRPQDFRDAMIAGIVLSSKATLATRNTAHFEDLSLRVVNPWEG